jgi:hypothetical protein
MKAQYLFEQSGKKLRRCSGVAKLISSGRYRNRSLTGAVQELNYSSRDRHWSSTVEGTAASSAAVEIGIEYQQW